MMTIVEELKLKSSVISYLPAANSEKKSKDVRLLLLL
jgi:hypothetical protein